MKQPTNPGFFGVVNDALFGTPDPLTVKRQRRLAALRYARYVLAEIAFMLAICFAFGVFVFGLLWLMGGAA